MQKACYRQGQIRQMCRAIRQRLYYGDADKNAKSREAAKQDLDTGIPVVG